MGSYGGIPEERNQDAVVFVGELAPEVTEALLWELMLQVGPVVSVHIPRDKVSSTHGGFGFVEYASERDADYAIRVMNLVKLFGRPIRVNRSNTSKRSADVGANLFVGNLDPSVDEAQLTATFATFGALLSPPKVMRDDAGASKGYAFLGYDSFVSSDAAIAAMNGQFLANRPISVTYAYRRDAKTERHGSESERLLAQKQSSQQPTQSQQQQQSQTSPAIAALLSGVPFVPPPGVFTVTPPPPSGK